MPKVLVTGGCSFTANYYKDKTWSYHLAKHLKDYDFHNFALPSQGNGLISRSVIYGVQHLLKFHAPEDILVGIMWSGKGRHDYYCEDHKELHFVLNKIDNNWMRNPTEFLKFEENTIPPNWVILAHHWKYQANYNADIYYNNFYSTVGAAIYSLEHILRVQWFLKLHKIKYFMTTYMDHVLHKDKALSDPEAKYLYDMVDFDEFLPVTSESGWLKTVNHHPLEEEHLRFTNEIIIPHLHKKVYI